MYEDAPNKLFMNLCEMESSTLYMQIYKFNGIHANISLNASYVFPGVCIYVFREYIRENVVDEVSTVAHRSLSDEVVIQKAEEVSKDLLHAIFTDPTIHKQAGKCWPRSVFNRYMCVQRFCVITFSLYIKIMLYSPFDVTMTSWYFDFIMCSLKNWKGAQRQGCILYARISHH